MIRIVSIRIVFQISIAVLCVGLFWGGFACSEPSTGPKVCNYEHQCQAHERCIFEDPSCVARTGQCKGICVGQEPVPEKTCACKKDSDCNEPFESCAACQCIKRSVIPCKSDKDCSRGWFCIGAPGKSICEQRSTCQKDSECPHGFECRDNSCCNVKTNRCPPGTCKEGIPCDTDIDCYYCNMRCKAKKCTFESNNPCEGVKCTEDKDCASCKGTCKAGFCKSS